MSQTPGKPPRKPVSYRDAGVDINAGDELVRRIKPLVAATTRPEVLGGLGGFGGLFHLGDRFRDPVLVSGTDGVGTKLLLARALNKHDTIGIDLVAMCVNDILVTGAEPLFFLDYFACGRLDPERAAAVVAGIAEGCKQADCALIGGETAEMPGMYGDGEYDLAGFAVGAVERDRLIDGSGIDDDCVLVGIASSGPHSNGYSLIRRILDAAGEEGAERGAALLEPTRIYADTVAALTAAMDVRGLAHITGGGLTENIIRILPDGLGIEIDPSAWDTPEVFRWIAETGPVETAEMRRTFNMGIGLVAVVPADRAGEVTSLIGEAAPVIGRVVSASGSGPRVTYRDS